MPELSEMLERADRAVGSVPLPPAGFEGVRRSRERRQRNRRIRAGALGLFVALAVGLAAGRALLEPEPVDTPDPTPSPSPEPVGFIGLPPEGAEPTPITDDLLYYMETSAREDEFHLEISVFTDGLVIWSRHDGITGIPEGAKEQNTGYLMQVLTPEGVELLRDEIYGTGFFGDGAAFRGGYAGPFEGDVGRFHGPEGMWLDVYDAQRTPITLSWYANRDEDLLDGAPTDAERETIARLVDRLADPAAWLPETAWEQRELQAFVASTYTVYICCGNRDIAALPSPADTILADYEEWHCITTDQAREIAEAFDALGIRLTQPWYPGGDTYSLEDWSEYRSNDHVVALYPRFDMQC